MSASEDSVDARLRRASAMSETMTSSTPRVEMTREAIDARLREAAELQSACLRLARAGRTGP